LAPDGRQEQAEAPKYQHFFWTAEWRTAVPDTVLAHLDFRLRGQTSCERKSRVQGVTLIVLSASVPVAAAAQVPRWSIALLGALASVAAAVGQLYGWKENAVRESRSVMQIQHELVLWKNGKPPYQELKKQPRPRTNDAWDEDDSLLSVRVEAIAQSEGKEWASWFEDDMRGESVRGQRRSEEMQ
jgi:hypothetical protein